MVLSISSSCTQVEYIGRFCVCLVYFLCLKSGGSVWGFFPFFKSSGLHFGVKSLIKPSYKSNNLEMGNGKYIGFSLDFRCIMYIFNQRSFFQRTGGMSVPKSCWKPVLHSFSCRPMYIQESTAARYRDPKGLCLDLCELPMQRLSESSVLSTSNLIIFLVKVVLLWEFHTSG